MSRPPTPVQDRLLRRRSIDPESGCWNWAGYIGTSGYGQIRMTKSAQDVHRVSYLTFIGPIPDGLHLDHLCRNRACFNPDHLEPVTPRENNRRSETCPSTVNLLKTHCIRGHEFSPENLYKSSRARVCRTCVKEHQAQARRAAGVPERSRAPFCGRGHSMTDEANVRLVNGDPKHRVCRACESIRCANYRARKQGVIETRELRAA